MLNQADLTSTIKTIPWFLELTPDSLHRLSKIAEVRAFEKGDVIFSEGEQHPFFYIILEGRVCLESYTPGHGSLPILTAESLDVIGWSSLTPVVRQKTSTARALERTTLLAFSAESLMNACEADSNLGFIIMRRLANIVASRMLNHRLHLLGILSSQGD
jgi:CRP/FNR family transcriptional regulator, cyclic AMP receptor protein